jgi:hypothetical protein
MANALLSQSQSQACDLAEQMGQRLKVTEAMLVEAVKARERLVENNKSTVEGLLSTISSNDQLLNVHTHTHTHTHTHPHTHTHTHTPTLISSNLSQTHSSTPNNMSFLQEV